MTKQKKEIERIKILCYERGFHDSKYLGRKDFTWLKIKPKQPKPKKKINKHTHKWQYATSYIAETKFVCECGKVKYVNET